jgi:hypothetical protein
MLHREMELWGGLLQECKDDIKNGRNSNCFVTCYLQRRSEAGYSDAPGKGVTADGWIRDMLLTYVAATPLEAGSDTTAITIETFILFMLSHPHILRRVREEMDAVVGDDRMPNFEDEGKLPYLAPCIMETLRRRPPVIMGMFFCLHIRRRRLNLLWTQECRIVSSRMIGTMACLFQKVQW